MTRIAVIALGGAAGAVLRFWLSTAVHALAGRSFPWGTLAVNVAGSFLIGALAVWLLERSALGELWRLGLLVGALGGFTTFSTFSLETLNLYEDGLYLLAGANAVASVLLCLAGTWCGVAVARGL